MVLIELYFFTPSVWAEGPTEPEPQANMKKLGSGKPPLKDSPKGSPKSAKDQEYVAIDFNNVDIAVFIKYISELTGKNFVVDNRVKGKVTIISPGKISVKEAFKVFESVLEVHGYTTVKAGQIIKIVSSPDARTKNIETLTHTVPGEKEDKLVTQLVHLKYANPAEIKRLFTPLISKSSVMLAYAPTNMLIITDYYSNIQRLLNLLKAIDVTGIGQEITVIPVENADATKLVKLLESIFKVTKRGKKSTIGKTVKFVADDRTNTIILFASALDTERAEKLISVLDKKIPRGKEKIHVYYLENATAEELAKVLQAVPSKKTTNVKRGKKAAPIVSDTVKITADKATNSLIIMAEKDEYHVLEEIIKKLDIPRSMVFIESLIMEVDVDSDFRLGTEWIVGGKTSFDNHNGYVGGGFSGGAAGGDAGYSSVIPSVAGLSVAAPLPPGFSMGVFSETLTIGNFVFPNLGAVIQAYKKDKDAHILSTPQILTTDNEEATITVGKNLPFQTRTSTTNNDTYNSFEYKDVGKILKITPQISKDRLVRLKISLEVTDLESTTDFRPTTLKRTIDTTVIVKDGNTVVIGGLIDDKKDTILYRVPCLGDIPGLGWLFKSKSIGGSRTNLYVFLTPRVVKNPAEATAIYDKKYSEIEKIEKSRIKMYDSAISTMESDMDELENDEEDEENDQQPADQSNDSAKEAEDVEEPETQTEESEIKENEEMLE